MSARLRHLLLVWSMVTAAGCVVGVQLALERLRVAFESQSQSAYDALSQQVREHETLVEALALLQPDATPDAQGVAEQRLGSLYPAVHRVLRHDERTAWPSEWQAMLARGESRSQQTSRAALAQFDLATGSYWLVRHAKPAAFALQLDLRQMAAQTIQKMLPGRVEAGVWLEHAGARRIVAPGAAAVDDGTGWRLGFRRRLALESTAVDFVAERRVDWLALPWAGLAAWLLATSVTAWGLAAWLRGRGSRDTRGKPSAGRLAWKTEGRLDRREAAGSRAGGAGAVPAVVAPSPPRRPVLQVSLRELDAEPPELIVARGAIQQAAHHSRRTAQAIAQLRRIADQPERPACLQQVDWDEVLRDAMELIEPECERLGVVTALVTDDAARRVRADPVALEQIVHHLLSGALCALAATAAGERRIEVAVAVRDDGFAELTVRDTGPGLTPQDAQHSHGADATPEPRIVAMGRCAALACAMGGSLTAGHAAPRGAVFRLSLPLAG